jgi:hypothetical protein
MKKQLFPIVSILLLVCACNESEMDRTIFIPDDNDKNLPAYTEWGYNSFGAKYERTYFLATNDIVPCKITYQNGMLNFYLSGYLVGNVASHYYNAEKMTLAFSFPSSPMNNYADLVSLNDTQIDLTDASCIVKIERNNVETALIPRIGHLTFKRAQLLSIDDEVNRVILSGTFDIQFLMNGRPENISDGRFDVGINKDFYNYSE